MKLTLTSILALTEPRDKFLIGDRKPNEDSILPPIKIGNGYMFGIADGLGSYKGAQEASNFVCDYLRKKNVMSHEYLEKCLKNDLKENFISYINSLDSDYIRASTTFSFCFFDNLGLSIWHIGDCRVYLKQDSKLIQLTNDHTQYQQLLDKKIYSKRELSEKKINQNTLTNAISTFIDLVNDYKFIPLDFLKNEYGENISILIMSDGTHHFWDQRKNFSKATMNDVIKFGNALKRRIENKGPTDDYSLIGTNFNILN